MIERKQKEPIIMRRIAGFAYGSVSYVIFLVTFLYAVGFIGNFGVPKSLDSAAAGPSTTALAIDVGLLALFALQHSVMARRGFKSFLTRFITPALERSTYVLASSLALLLLFWLWRPLGGVVWDVQNPIGRILLYGGFAFGWALVLLATVVINHFDLFGMRQVWRYLQGKPHTGLQFVTPVLYRVVRHPLYVGWFCAFWFTPTMTVTHLFFALMTSAYILIAIQLEERDLIKEHPEYAAYRKQVPMLIPSLPKQVSSLNTSATAPAVKGARV